MRLFLFPGQGSQYGSMLKKYSKSRVIAALKESQEFRDDIIKLEEGTDMYIRDMAQPAVFLYSMCDFYERFDDDNQMNSCIFIGHSAGEYAALCAARVLSIHDGFRLVLKRSHIMRSLAKEGESGAMYALVGNDILHKLTPKIISCIAAINSKSQVTISGPMDFLREQIIKNLPPNVRCIKLNVSHAFHSHSMQSARSAYMDVLGKLKFNPEHCFKVISNVTARPHAPDTLRRNLLDHLTKPVLWNHSLKCCFALGSDIEACEIDPGNALSKFFDR